MFREWTALRCVTVALQGVFMSITGFIIMIILIDRSDLLSVRLVFSFSMALALIAAGVLEIRVANIYWI